MTIPYCEACGGSGVSECPLCEDHKEVDCFNCSGTGDLDCPLCKGAGEVVVETGNAEPPFHETKGCILCAGEKKIDCHRCEGTGDQVCPVCRSGPPSCKTCNGSGKWRK